MTRKIVVADGEVYVYVEDGRVERVVAKAMTVQGVMLDGDWEFAWEELDPESEAAMTAAREWLAWQGWTVTAVMPQDEGRDRTTSSPGGTASS